ncbi:MAG: hypothetical protein EPN23_03215 [Verrucomicrobia bacterium]|nr:MAG: hypothetical protein EPN23_03215 [Verrucomicrobiota bacterium]
MRSVWAIALISLRNAIRSRVVALLLTILVVGIIAIPLTVKSDGTLTGYVQILVRYTLGFSIGILMMATVWAGCAAVSLEIQLKQIHLLVTKPVSAMQLWLGKWLGLVILNSAALLVCAGTTYGLLRWNTRAQHLGAADQQKLASEIMVARVRLAPLPFALEERVRARFAELAAHGEVPTNMPVTAVLAALQESAQMEAHTVAPRGNLTWRFVLPAALTHTAAFQLRYKLASSFLAPLTMQGRWIVGREQGGQPYESTQAHPSNGQHSLTIPGTALRGTGALLVTYSNVNQTPVTLIFGPEKALELLAPVGGWLPNFARALLISACLLALIAALGVTAGSLFSMPVAAFVVFQALVLISTAGMIHSLAAREVNFTSLLPGHLTSAAWLDQTMVWFYRVLEILVMPMRSADPMALVAAGEWVSWPMVAWAFLQQIVLASGVLLLLAVAALRRRELALPAD